MTRKLGALGLALTAVLAIAAVAASSASAAGEKFHCTESQTERCTLTATSEEGTQDEFEASGIAIKCTAHFRGTAPEKTVDSVTITPEYTTGTCSESAHVTFNHCDYLFTSTTTSGVAPVHLQCSGGSRIEWAFTNLGCTLHFGEQTPTGGVKYTNLADGTVTVEWNISGITFEVTGPFFPCGFITGTGKYRAKDIITCYEDTENAHPTGTAGTTPGTTTHGKQVKCDLF